MSYYAVMFTDAMSIGELAEATGVSRRAVRFYVQQGLLPPPVGLGRGSHYEPRHLDALRRIEELQRGGHSLDAIKRILGGAPVPAPRPAPNGRVRVRSELSAELQTRIRLLDGVELHFDAAKFNPEVEGLMELRDLARSVFEQQRDS